ncbi:MULTISPECIES: TetR/AcrR family transcriptional regulator [Pantoea]|uniref:TetR family transcriptional regulator n=1 Tax=Candidatus Pantoea gossypiicola TaxID=2608008 RepID=A0AB34CKK0_9GAMM|nr:MULTISPECIES: TetR/AcrR family transcriptional regulator [Pantoea]KAA5931486.1 TetR family transcriptional regulator [Pantoea sp. VH_8]KAA5936621.1 TetR family transcriptional regulator [Pantoea sp. VH_4]KAA5987891.1 TetR family transcriptional regulator [Pantoea sp. M_4]KAA6126883.1 TetR family transcriptional regulator [Pantoea gossypiicola]
MKESAEVLRTKILDAAIVLFVEKGIEKVTTRELTESVGISRSHIYHYFSNWQTLCLAALERFMRVDFENFADTLALLTPRQRLNTLFESHLPSAPDATWQLYASFWQMAAHNDAYAALAEEMTEVWQALMEGIIRDGVTDGTLRCDDVPRTARQISAMLNGYADLLTINPSESKAREAMADLNQFVEFALGPCR